MTAVIQAANVQGRIHLRIKAVMTADFSDMISDVRPTPTPWPFAQFTHYLHTLISRVIQPNLTLPASELNTKTHQNKNGNRVCSWICDLTADEYTTTVTLPTFFKETHEQLNKVLIQQRVFRAPYLGACSGTQTQRWRRCVEASRVSSSLCTSRWCSPSRWAGSCRGWWPHRRGRSTSVVRK